jgi:hypothetical protein
MKRARFAEKTELSLKLLGELTIPATAQLMTNSLELLVEEEILTTKDQSLD